MDRKRHIPSFFWLVFLFCIPESIGFGAEICGYREMGIVEVTRGGKVIGEFSVTLAESAKSKRRGLMNCQSLHPGTGMLFIYPDARPRVFWMKNTRIELAIIFLSADGRITAIEHGEPGSLHRIHSSGNIQSVLEINYRESRPFKPGDVVRLRLGSHSNKRAARPAMPEK